ncbi:hypothetical protein VTP01DRAFT_5209 [Rhizomucor pusillus]|uniref:uncharacterized protein n=1 Tax=Rhizomucor pusillus TaxID=4840 RepID=UPI0037442B43
MKTWKKRKKEIGPISLSMFQTSQSLSFRVSTFCININFAALPMLPKKVSALTRCNAILRPRSLRALSSLERGNMQDKSHVENYPAGRAAEQPAADTTGNLMTSAPRWNEKLASESEACVKADQEPVQSVQDLETRSVNWFRKHEKPDGTVVDIPVD